VTASSNSFLLRRALLARQVFPVQGPLHGLVGVPAELGAADAEVRELLDGLLGSASEHSPEHFAEGNRMAMWEFAASVPRPLPDVFAALKGLQVKRLDVRDPYCGTPLNRGRLPETARAGHKPQSRPPGWRRSDARASACRRGFSRGRPPARAEAGLSTAKRSWEPPGTLPDLETPSFQLLPVRHCQLSVEHRGHPFGRLANINSTKPKCSSVTRCCCCHQDG
jgi:hypothetical protein